MRTITKARLVKFIGAVLIAIGATTFYLGDSIEKDLMKLDQSRFGEAVLK